MQGYRQYRADVRIEGRRVSVTVWARTEREARAKFDEIERLRCEAVQQDRLGLLYRDCPDAWKYRETADKARCLALVLRLPDAPQR